MIRTGENNLYLGLQRQLSGHLVAEVNYQGTMGRKLPFFGDPNRFSGDRLRWADPQVIQAKTGLIFPSKALICDRIA